MKYPVMEQFTSFQGEGIHMGKRAHFIRLQGCDVGCTWCDTKESWRKGKKNTEASVLTEGMNVGEIVIVTGGEPTIHDLRPLTEALDHQYRHLETAGHLPITGNWSWVTLSPKSRKPPLTKNVKRANEFKIIVAEPDDILAGMDAIGARGQFTTVWLHPEWSKRDDKNVLDAITNYVLTKDRYGFLRAGWQNHKNYGAR